MSHLAQIPTLAILHDNVNTSLLSVNDSVDVTDDVGAVELTEDIHLPLEVLHLTLGFKLELTMRSGLALTHKQLGQFLASTVCRQGEVHKCKGIKA